MTLNRVFTLLLVTMLSGPEAAGLTGHLQLPDSTEGTITLLARFDEACNCLSATLKLRSGSSVSLRLCNLLGQEVTAWSLGYLPPGSSHISRSLPNLASGVYFLIAEAEDATVVKKLICVR